MEELKNVLCMSVLAALTKRRSSSGSSLGLVGRKNGYATTGSLYQMLSKKNVLYKSITIVKALEILKILNRVIPPSPPPGPGSCPEEARAWSRLAQSLAFEPSRTGPCTSLGTSCHVRRWCEAQRGWWSAESVGRSAYMPRLWTLGHYAPGKETVSAGGRGARTPRGKMIQIHDRGKVNY